MNHIGQKVRRSLTIGALLLIAAPALATGGSGFTPSPVSTGHYDALDVKADKTEKWDLFLKTKDSTDVGVDRLTVLDSGQSGWHSHPAPVFITVISGTIQWYDGSSYGCPVRTYHAGQSFIEPANHVHLVRNTSGDTAQFIGVRISPTGVQFRIDEDKPYNCPSF